VRAEQRFHPHKFTEEYLLKLEPYWCHQWLQVSKDQLNLCIEDKHMDFNQQYCICGHHHDNNDEEYVEFRIDMTNEVVQQEASRQHEFGITTNIQVKDDEF
jgi:hypothetical protein